MRNQVPFYAMVLIISVAACLTYNYFTQVEEPSIDARLELHSQIIHGQAPSPYNYRVLVPWATEAVAFTASLGNRSTYIRAWQLAYVGYDFISITLFLATLFLLLRTWYSVSLSTIGVLFCASLLPLSLRDHYFQPWSLIEAWFFCLAFLLSYHKKLSFLFLLTAAAALNRATSIFIPAIYFLGSFQVRWIREQRYRDLFSAFLKSAALLLLAVTVLMLVRHIQGYSEHIHTIEDLWQRNTTPGALTSSAIHWILFLGGGWLFLLPGWRQSGEFLRNQLLIVPLYLVPVILFGVWHEVRLFLPLYPVLISLILKPAEKELAQ